MNKLLPFLLTALAVVLVTLTLTGLAMHNFHTECVADAGTVTVDKWHGIPVESTCTY